MSGPDEPPAPRPGRVAGFLAWWQRHPVAALLVLTPGIPEYLSSSSSLTVLVANPPVFLLFLAANLGLYGPGVLLIREAAVRWRKGWPTIIVLGAAYGIVEEGIALSTLFNPAAGPVGVLGAYGHWLGVSWVWSTGVLMVHVVFSISLPILLLGLALPSTRGVRFLSYRGIAVAVAILVTDVTVLAVVIWKGFGFWMGAPILVGSLLVVGALVALARALPPDLLAPASELPRARPRTFFLLGALLFPGTLLLESVSGALGAPAAVAVLLLLVFYVVLLLAGRAWVGRSGYEGAAVAFAAGALGPIALLGFLVAWPVPVVAVADVLLVLFLLRLWRRYREAPHGWPGSMGWSTHPVPPHPR